MNVDFGSLAGGVLHDEEHFGDELDDVTRLEHQVAFPLAVADGRRVAGPVAGRVAPSAAARDGRRRLELQAARLKVLHTR